MLHSSEYMHLNYIAPLLPKQSESTVTMAPWSRQAAVTESEAVCGAVRHPLAVHEAPNAVRTPPPDLETSVPDLETVPIACILLFYQARSGADPPKRIHSAA